MLSGRIWVSQNYSEAFQWFQKAADKNNAWALNRLGHFYWKGSGVEKSEDKAFEMFLKAADLGNMYAQNSVGWFYYHGMSPESEKPSDPRKPSYRKKDFQKAFEWTLRSAENGYPDAQYNVAIFYWRGEGTQVDLEKARFWMTKAADKDVPKAKETLGWITLGRNVEKITQNWFSLGEDPKKESATNPQ